MRISVMDQVFDFPGLGAIVASHVRDPLSNKISVEEVVSAVNSNQKEAGVAILFNKCITQFAKTTEEKRLVQLAEGAFRSYKIIKAANLYTEVPDETKIQFNAISLKYNKLFISIIGKQVEKLVVHDAKPPVSDVKEKIEEPSRVEPPSASEPFARPIRALSPIKASSEDKKDYEIILENGVEYFRYQDGTVSNHTVEQAETYLGYKRPKNLLDINQEETNLHLRHEEQHAQKKLKKERTYSLSNY